MAYWLVKEEPHKYNFSILEKDGVTDWTGVRNYQARNFMREMKVGDQVMYYHTGKERSAVGTAKVVKTAYTDPTATEGDWSCVDIEYGEALPRPVSLAEIKADPTMSECGLVRRGRLSVIPLTAAEFKRIWALSKQEKK